MAFNYKNPLRLTSPLTSGPRVKKAQELLAGQGPVLKRKLYTAAIDGQYGEHCAHATKSAKYWIGYPKKKIDGAFGEELFHFLTGKKKLTPIMKWRRRHRIKLEKKRAKTGGLYKRAITLAGHYVGVHESPAGSNMQEFGAWYGMNGVPWCAIFVSFILSHVAHPFRHSYVPEIVATARAGHDSMATIAYADIAHAISVGHAVLACFDWNHDGVADHVGFVVRTEGAYFETIEGNTSPPGGNQSNGGQVCRQTRYPNEVQAFVVVYGK